MACPVQISDDSNDGFFMGLDGTEIFRATIDKVERYTWPGLSYIDDAIADVGTITWPSPFGLDSQNTLIGTETTICVGPDGRFYAWLFNNGSPQETAVVTMEEDGTDPQVLYLLPSPPAVLAYGRITWHPETPGVVWCTYRDDDAGTYDLFTVDRSTGSRVDKLDLSAYDLPPFHVIQRYDTGIIIALGVSPGFDTLLAYDVVSETSDTISTPGLTGFGTYWSEHQVLWNAGANQADAVDIDNTGSVSLTNGTTACDAWLADGSFYRSNTWQQWIDPTYSHVYVSDGSYIWDLDPVTGGWTVGRVAWGSRGGWH